MQILDVLHLYIERGWRKERVREDERERDGL
jgi:hypothetical protein